jgi:hypothetical protein
MMVLQALLDHKAQKVLKDPLALTLQFPALLV